MNVLLTLYHSSALISYFTEETGLNKIKQAGNQKRYNLQGVQKWKSKQSITISNKYDIYIIYMISLNKHQK